MNRQSMTFQDMALEDDTARPEGIRKMTWKGQGPIALSTVNYDAIESTLKGSSIADGYRYKRKDQSFLEKHRISTWTMRTESRQARNSQTGDGSNQDRHFWYK